MIKVRILFFAADPQSAPPDGRAARLRLDEDVRQIRHKVRGAEHRDALEFDVHWAARTDDLLQALNETRPQVVHFSGHGGSDGLVLVSADGRRPHLVDAPVLKQLFEVFRGDIRVVVLSACFSLPQAEAIAASVGCAIGTHGAISDEAAVTFNASFYRAVAFGHSVQAAYEQARTALALEHFDDRECPVLVTRPDVDPAQLFLVAGGDADAPGREADTAAPLPLAALPRERRPEQRAKWIGVGAAALVLSLGAVLASDLLRDRDPDDGAPGSLTEASDSRASDASPQRVLAAEPAAKGTGRPTGSPAAAATKPDDPGGTMADLEAAKALRQSGNHAAAFPLFLRAAEDGNPEAMGFVGMMYLSGEGTARSPDAAIPWLRRARDARDPRGMNALGLAYQRGEGVERSYRWAKYWYLAAAEEKGYAPAMENLGSLYRQGLGVERSDSQAMEWYRKAVSAGSLDAAVDLGLMHEEGMGTPRDPQEALRLYRVAADGGAPRGMFSMGRMYQEGIGVDQSYARAREWYLKGADAGSADAMNNLGLLYHNGWGVRRNRAEAIRWFRRAADAGSTLAAGNLAALEDS
jgi:TPR repeat protein